ncbi:MAG: CusA/CzcA family heavy metal efflux RND transporter [Syntrophobacterales bacterium]|nr:CusA/CzcA family heavy metal efflux RND transporter [Syntrophobacterales bacterium]
MVARLIDLCVKNRGLVLLVWLAITAWGLYCTYNLPVDAIPDLSDVQVIIRTEWPEQAPQVVEDQVTYPLSTAMLAVPQAKVVRGYSSFGYSLVYILFEDGTDIYWARSRVLEYLNVVRGRLPAGVNPQLGPDATGVGWVFQYVLEDPTGRHDLAQLRSIQDWYLRYQLQAVPGVAEVASVGGFVKQYQVVVDPNRLAAYNLPLSRLREAIQRANQDTGGRVVEMAEIEYMVRGLGYIRSVADVENIVVAADPRGTPVRVKDVGLVRLGPELRRGLAEANGMGEVVGGIVVMRHGENARAVIQEVKSKLEELKAGLPPGVRIVTAYDRSGLIERAIDTLKWAIYEQVAIVSLITVLFLLHLRSAIVAIISLPLGVLISFILQYQFNITANILSLAGIAIAIGDMVDASMVMVENAHKKLEDLPPGEDRTPIVLEAAKEVGPSLFFSLLVLTVSFLPIFALQGESGRLFKPLAYTKTFAMAGASLLAITLIPILMVVFIRGRIPREERNPLSRAAQFLYRPFLELSLRYPAAAIVTALVVLAVSIYPLTRLGSEFMPPLDEGDLLYMPTTMPGLSITKAREVLQQTDRIIKTFPEVEYVFGKVGRADTATDPAPLSMIETTIKLKPREQWRPGYDTERLIRELDQAVRFPGLANSWGYPIKIRIDMLSTGMKTPVGLKLLGPDLHVLTRLGTEAEAILREVPGTASVFAERPLGGYYLDFKINREEAARYGLNVGDIQDVIATGLGGMTLTQTVEGLERYPVNLRYFQDYRENLPALKRLLIPTPTGAQIPMGQVAELTIRQGPDMIKSEGGRPSVWLYVDIRDIDLGGYLAQARRAIAEKLRLPAGYSLVWSGQFEYLERARERLLVIVPITLALIVVLMYLATFSFTKVVIILLSLPFSIVGGIWLLYLLDYNLSLGVVVGMIALLGLDAETGVVMLLYQDLVYQKRKEEGRLRTRQDLIDAVREGALMRLRPKLMTVLANIFGLLPVMWATGTGAEVAKRIAAPMVGGVTTSFLLELLVYPAIYQLWKWHAEVKHLGSKG